MKKILSFICCLNLVVLFCNAQSPYIRSNNIGNVKKEAIDNRLYGPLNYRDLNQMLGEKFILLPKSAKTKKYGYQSLYKIPYKNLLDNVPYDSVGKIIVLKSLDATNGYFSDDQGGKYKGSISLGSISGIAPVRDIDSARIMFMGKTLWLKSSSIATYNEDTDAFGSVDDLKLEPVKVVDIVAGWYEYSPVRFILQTNNGSIGYIECSMSGSNASSILRDSFSFNDEFWTDNPKKLYNFTPQVWNAIKNRTVHMGMTKTQVRLSIGEPDDIRLSQYGSETKEQWIYGKTDRTYYYFTNGKLTAQN